MYKRQLRYSELKNEMTNITDAVLAVSLKELIENNIIKRTQYDCIPVKVEYSLTEKGISVVPILQNICKWSSVYYNNKNDDQLPQCKKCKYMMEEENKMKNL